MTVFRYTPSEIEKDRALGDVFYEIQQLWISTHLTTDNPLVNNAFLESSLVHVRVLLDFFERSKRSTWRDGKEYHENDDVLSVDYEFEARPINITEIYRQRLNKDLVHLAYSRGSRLPESRGWPREEVVIPIIERSIEFIDCLDEEKINSTVGVSIAQWKELRQNLEALRHASG
jgi:hypothetical protein